eukprot:GEMP01097617.1.p1 GENE.GEMP01097617.1~~GEMP01097617.1.p1  ORF type:complete len:150 (+),score=15.82 GEMP01097617.1:63-512(+)
MLFIVCAFAISALAARREPGHELEPPENYSGICNKELRCSYMSMVEKQELESTCGDASMIRSDLVSSLLEAARDQGNTKRLDLICVRDYSGCDARFPCIDPSDYSALCPQGIFATTPMRSPPRAMINIIENENTQSFQLRGGNAAKENK